MLSLRRTRVGHRPAQRHTCTEAFYSSKETLWRGIDLIVFFFLLMQLTFPLQSTAYTGCPELVGYAIKK